MESAHMHLVSLLGDGDPDMARLGVEASGRVLAVENVAADLPGTMDELLRNVSDGLARIAMHAEPGRIEREGTPLDETRLAAPVPRPGKIVAIGRNYPDHNVEQGSVP